MISALIGRGVGFNPGSLLFIVTLGLHSVSPSAIPTMIARGIGFSPGSVRFVVVLGLHLGEAPPPTGFQPFWVTNTSRILTGGVI